MKKEHKEYILPVLMVLAVLFLVLGNMAYADDDEKGEKGERGEQGIKGDAGAKGDTGAQGIAGLSGKNGINGINGVNATIRGIALGMAAAQIHPDWGVKDLQLGVGVGVYDGNEAAVVGIGKRVGKVLFNGSVGREGGEYAYGAGINIHF